MNVGNNKQITNLSEIEFEVCININTPIDSMSFIGVGQCRLMIIGIW